jgi:hypothetical protein
LLALMVLPRGGQAAGAHVREVMQRRRAAETATRLSQQGDCGAQRSKRPRGGIGYGWPERRGCPRHAVASYGQANAGPGRQYDARPGRHVAQRPAR